MTSLSHPQDENPVAPIAATAPGGENITEATRTSSQPEAQSAAAESTDAQKDQVAAVDPAELREKIIQVLHTVYDPEIPVDIWELGLVYRLDVREDRDVFIQMTLTSPMCPVAGSLPPEVQQKVASVPGVRNVQVDLTWDPPWHMGMMTDVARLKLGFM